MIRNDYILRLIEQAAQAIGRAMGFVAVGELQQALDMLRRESERLVGLDGAMLEMLAPDALRRAFRTPDDAFVAGRLLEAIAEVHEKGGDAAPSAMGRMRALDLYVGVLSDDAGALEGELMRRARALAARVTGADADEQFALTWHERRRLMRCCEVVGAYADAEDVLFELLEGETDVDTILSDGLALYDRLLRKTDDDLASGGLPRREVEDGRSQVAGRDRGLDEGGPSDGEPGRQA